MTGPAARSTRTGDRTARPAGPGPADPAPRAGDPLGRSLRVAKTGETIAAFLRARIVRGELARDECLPSELELMRQFDVSRPTLREAFRILETEQLISIRRGSRGARVLAPDVSVAARYAGLLLQVSGTTLGDVYRARSVIEPAAAGLLARSHTDEDLAVLTACVEDLERRGREGRLPDDLGDLGAWTEAAQRFHDLVTGRCGNTTLAVQSSVLREVVATHLATAMRRGTGEPTAIRDFKRFAKSCRRLVELVAAGDADGAERHWRAHMEAAERFLLAGDLGATTVLDLFR